MGNPKKNGKNVYKHDEKPYYLWWYSTKNTKGRWYLGTEENIGKPQCFICTRDNDIEKDSPLDYGYWQGFYNNKWSLLHNFKFKRPYHISISGLKEDHQQSKSMGKYILDDEKINGQFCFRIDDPNIDRYLWWHIDEQWVIGKKEQRGGNYCVLYTDTESLGAGTLPPHWKGKWKVLENNQWKTTSSINCIFESADLKLVEVSESHQIYSL